MKDTWRHPATILAIAGATAVVLVGVTNARRRRKRFQNKGAKALDTGGVQLYGAPWCPACMRLKEDLAERQIPFTFRDIDTDKRADTFVMKQSEEGIIPVTTVNGQTFLGYAPDDIENAYKGLQA